MNVQARHSAAIERMHRARNVPTCENRKTWSPMPHAGEQCIKVHPRLWRLRRAIRRQLGLRDVREILAVLDELRTLLVRCGYHVRWKHAQRAWKRQRSALPFNRFTNGGPNPARGRPRGSEDLALRQLGLGLAQLWLDLTGRQPGRRYSWATKREYGPYREFVQRVVDLPPRSLRVRRKGAVPSVDFLVRASIDELRAAQNAPEEYRRRGLIDEGRWLSGGDD
jgi:hypothetical protein